jgi:hypothetical protein
MWLAGMQEPDFRTISDFRKGKIGDIKELFRQVLETCVMLGMIRCGKISLDGTKIEANSGKNKITYRKTLEKRQARYEGEIEQIMAEAQRIDAEEDDLYGDQDGYSLSRAYKAEEIQKALKKIKRDKDKLSRRSAKVKDKLAIIEDKIKRMGNGRNSFGNTDKDATLMLMKEGNLGVGYNVQMATENQVILAYGIYQKANDVNLLQPMTEEIEQHLGKPETIIADKGYSSQDNYEFMERKGIKAAIPPCSFDLDQRARRKGTYKRSKNVVYEEIKGRILDYLETPQGEELLDRRKHDIEPTFGDIKHNMGFRKFLLRSNLKVTTEIGLISMAHNIKKMKKWLEIRKLVYVPV